MVPNIDDERLIKPTVLSIFNTRNKIQQLILMGVSIIIKAIAKNPPSVMMVVALAFGLVGAVTNNPFFLDLAIWCLIGSAFLQVAYLFSKRGRF